MITWLLKKCVPFETLANAAIDKGVAKANNAMAKEGAAVMVAKVAQIGKRVNEEANAVFQMLDDAKIDDAEKAALKARFVPMIMTLITKGLQA